MNANGTPPPLELLSPTETLLGATVLAFLLSIAAAYALRVLVVGALRQARLEEDGGSVLLGKRVMEAYYWFFGPLVRLLVRLGITANMVSWMSLGLGVGAGVAVGAGRFGLGAWLGTLSALGDAVDGLVARASGTSSDAGEVLDAAIDRVTELALLGGIAVAFRSSLPELLLVLAAMLASFMVSYATAKAEAMQIEAPRGAMRRSERAVYLMGGVMLTPVLGRVALAVGLPAESPLLLALLAIALIGNVSWVRRMSVLAERVAEREASARSASAELPAKPARPDTLEPGGRGLPA